MGVVQADKSSTYPRLAGLILTAGILPEEPIVSARLREVRAEITAGDREKIERVIELFNDRVDMSWLDVGVTHPRAMTPRMFAYLLEQKAKADLRRIVLAEGKDSRILRAAAEVLEMGAAELTLLGIPDHIEAIVRTEGIPLDLSKLRIVDPATSPWREEFARSLHQLLSYKGLTPEGAREEVLDASTFGTLMVHLGHADGMVSGTIHTTQQTIRPALRILKTRPGHSLVSSVFFMCLEDGVVVYGDCAVNPNPSAPQLAEIAIASVGYRPRIRDRAQGSPVCLFLGQFWRSRGCRESSRGGADREAAPE